MSKALKILGWSLGGLALALGAAALGLKLYFTQARLKALTTDYAARNLRREVTFDSVALGLKGLAIANLRVSEYPDFKRGEFFSAASFSVRPSFRSLLRGELKINSVTADALRMRVTEVKPETYNFSDLMPPPPQEPRQAAAPGQRQAAAPPQLSVSSLKVRGSSFSYANAAGDLAVTLKDINLSASGISPSGLFPVEADFTLSVASPYFKGEIPAALKGKLALGGFDPAKGTAEIERASLALGEVRAEAKGSLKNLLEPDAKLALVIKQFSTADLRTVFKGLPPKILLPEIAADADFKLTAKGVALRAVALRAGPVKANLKGRAAWNPRAAYDLQADVKAQVPEIDTTLLAKKARDFPVPKGLKLPLAEISARLKLKDGTAEVSSFTLESAPLSASGRSTVNFSGALRAAGSVNAEIKNFARVADIAPGLLKPYAPSGGASAALDYTYAGGKPAVSGRASLNGLGASFAGRALTGLTGTVEFTMDSASAKKLQGQLDGAELTASFKARDLLKHPKADFDLSVAKLVFKDSPAAPAKAAAKPAAAGAPGGEPFYLDVSGAARLGAIEHPNFRCGPASLKLDLVNISDDMKALDGSASFTAGPGRLTELYALAGKHKAAKVALYPLLVLQKSAKLVKGLKLPDFNNIDFEVLEGDYAFSKGLMKLNKSSLTAEVADVNSSGTINLPAEKLDMKITTTLKKASGITMSAPVGMLVKGTVTDPQVKLDVKSIAEQPAVKKALDKLAPGADKLLKGLFKKK
ncbi:MAG: AsmA-like C-terminal region-containing protein [Elusimicrobiales bacterium]|nr:AsmA-like C-terminal region-containing protein [Elusimicrobiales bacterium]